MHFSVLKLIVSFAETITSLSFEIPLFDENNLCGKKAILSTKINIELLKLAINVNTP